MQQVTNCLCQDVELSYSSCSGLDYLIVFICLLDYLIVYHILLSSHLREICGNVLVLQGRGFSDTKSCCGCIQARGKEFLLKV